MAKSIIQARKELKGKHIKMASYIRKAGELKVNSTQTETKAHLICNIAKDKLFPLFLKRKLTILQVPINLKDILPHKSHGEISNDKLRNIMCGRYGTVRQKYTYFHEYLHENIQYCISKKKIIFIMFGMESYCVYETTNLDTKRPCLKYATHSTCLILMPLGESYSAFYINSHGRDIQDTWLYKRIVSSTRTKNVTFDKPAELHFIRELIDSWNKQLDWNLDLINIKWNILSSHTYLDVNLQAGDNHGICFAFPQIILHQFGINFSTNRTFEIVGEARCSMTIKNSQHLLKNHQLSLFVKASFMELNTKFMITFLKQYAFPSKYRCDDIDELEKIIEDQQTNFIKTIICSLMRYLDQISFKVEQNLLKQDPMFHY